MGLFDSIKNLFSSGGTETEIQRLEMMTPEQKALLEKMLGQYSGMTGPQPKAPTMYAGPTQAETQLSNWAKSQAVKDMLAGKVPYEVGPEYAKQYFEKSIKPGMMANWEETVKPQIRESYAGPGYWSTARMRQETESAEELGRQLMGKESELIYSEELARRAAIDQALGRIPSTQQAVTGVAEMERSIEQERIMDAVTRFFTGEEVDGQYNPAYNPNVAIMLALLGIQPWTYAGAQTTTGPGLGYGILAGASEGVGRAFGNWLFPG